MMAASEISVLIVEDSDDDYDTVELAARRVGLGLRLVRAIDGESALALLAEQSAPGYRLVLLDNNLPGGMSGVDVLVELRSRAAVQHLPAVMFTTSSNTRDCLACYRAGANAYHVKAVGFDECLRTLAAIFSYWLREVVSPGAPGVLQ